MNRMTKSASSFNHCAWIVAESHLDFSLYFGIFQNDTDNNKKCLKKTRTGTKMTERNHHIHFNFQHGRIRMEIIQSVQCFVAYRFILVHASFVDDSDLLNNPYTKCQNRIEPHQSEIDKKKELNASEKQVRKKMDE